MSTNEEEVLDFFIFPVVYWNSGCVFGGITDVVFFFPTQAPHHHHHTLWYCFVLLWTLESLHQNRSLSSDPWALDRRCGFLARQRLFLLSPRDYEDKLGCVFLHLSFPLVGVSADAHDTAHKDQEADDS